MYRKIIRLYFFLREVIQQFIADKALKFSASLAYYTVFSVAPFLVIIISVTGFFFGREAIEGGLYQQINRLVGNEAALQIQAMITNIHLSKNSLLAGVVSFFVLIVGATGIFNEIQDSINHIWGLKSKPKKGWVKVITNRLISFSLIISLGFVLAVSLLLNTLLVMLGAQLMKLLPGAGIYIINVVNNVLTFCIITFLFGTIFKVLPDAKLRWRNVLAGAFATAVLFMVGKFCIGYYLGHSHLSSVYGTAGSIIIVMLWVYYTAVILYLGAEFTKVYSRYCGSKILPNDYAVWIQTREIESPGKVFI